MKRKTNRRRGGEEAVPIGTVLEAPASLTGPRLALATRKKEFDIHKNWDEIVGTVIAKRTRPARLYGKKLYITVNSSSWMNELQYHKEQLLKNLNNTLGHGAVTELVFTQSAITRAKKDETKKNEQKKTLKTRELNIEEKEFIEKTAGSVKDKELREIIKKAMEKEKVLAHGE